MDKRTCRHCLGSGCAHCKWEPGDRGPSKAGAQLAAALGLNPGEIQRAMVGRQVKAYNAWEVRLG